MSLDKVTRELVISQGYRAMQLKLKSLRDEEGLNIGCSLNDTAQELRLHLIWLTNEIVCEGFVNMVHIEDKWINISTKERKLFTIFLDKDLHTVKDIEGIEPHSYIKVQGKISDSTDSIHKTVIRYRARGVWRGALELTEEEVFLLKWHHSHKEIIDTETERFDNYFTSNFYTAGSKYYLSTNPNDYLYYTLDQIKQKYKENQEVLLSAY